MADSGATRQTRIVAAAAIAIAVTIKRRRKRRNRAVWTREWILRRESQGAFNQLMELRLCDVSSYRNLVRMDASTFEELLTRVAPRITYQDTVFRQAIPPAERLAITLRFLATGMLLHYHDHYIKNVHIMTVLSTGESFQSLQFLYRVPSQTIGKIVPETCSAIVEELKEEFMKVTNNHYENG